MTAPQEMRIGTCFITTKYHFSQFQADSCMKIDPDRKNYLLLGDSHSAALWYGLDKMMPNANILQASVSGCNPVLSNTDHTDCGQMMRYVFDEFLPKHAIQAVFLTARWSNEKQFDRISETVTWLNQHNVAVYILGPVLEYDSPLPKLLAYSIAFKDSDLPSRHMIKGFLALDQTMKHAAATRWNVHYASIIDVECADSRCIQFADSDKATPLMGDDNHLTNAGSLLVIHKLQIAGDLPS
jgi:hypothetical protein